MRRDLKQSDSDVSLNSFGLQHVRQPQEGSCKLLLQSLGKGRARATHSPTAKKRPAAGLEKAEGYGPEAYLQGTAHGLEKLRLVVEVPERRTLLRRS